jgi:sulfoxide reductase heme-binding subunit YedZ
VNKSLRRVPTWPLYLGLIVPGLVWFWLGATDQLGVDPLQALEDRYGKWALQLLLATLFVTPLRRALGLSLLKFRRALGLMAFFYIVLHLLVWVVLDKQFFWSEILKDLYKRPYIIVGMIAFVSLIPLALTSNNRSIRRLGAQKWTYLHRISYGAVILGAIHYVMVQKIWEIEPLLYVSGAVFLVLSRIRVPRGWKIRQMNQ